MLTLNLLVNSYDVDDDGEKVQFFPHAVYFLKENSIMAHMTATEENKVVVDIPASDASGRVICPDIVLYSKRSHAWLVFCKVQQVWTLQSNSSILFQHCNAIQSCMVFNLVLHRLMNTQQAH